MVSCIVPFKQVQLRIIIISVHYYYYFCIVWIYSADSTKMLEGKVDKKAMIRNRYNRIPHLALNTKRERDTYN